MEGTLRPPAHCPAAPSGYTYAYCRIRNPQQKYVKRAVRKAHFKLNRAFTANSSISTTPLKFEDVPARNAFEYLQTIYIARN